VEVNNSFCFFNEFLLDPYEDPIESDTGLSTGAIIGIAIGGVVACIFVGVGAWILIKKKGLAKLNPATSQNVRRPKESEPTELAV